MKLNTQPDQVVETRNMSYDSKARQLCAFASDIGFRGMWRLYDDACDFGLWVKSHKTGNLEAFYYDETCKDNDGDVSHWMLKNDKLNMTLILFNT